MGKKKKYRYQNIGKKPYWLGTRHITILHHCMILISVLIAISSSVAADWTVFTIIKQRAAKQAGAVSDWCCISAELGWRSLFIRLAVVLQSLTSQAAAVQTLLQSVIERPDFWWIKGCGCHLDVAEQNGKQPWFDTCKLCLLCEPVLLQSH